MKVLLFYLGNNKFQSTFRDVEVNNTGMFKWMINRCVVIFKRQDIGLEPEGNNVWDFRLKDLVDSF